MKAKKSFGQNFLINDGLCKSIVQSLPVNDQIDMVLEVGPGRGALTKYLLELDKPYRAIEVDWDMVNALKKRFPSLDEDVLMMDFLKADLNQLFESKKIGLIGNFPYNISSQIIFKLLEHRDNIPVMVGMFQRELADRLLASPGSKTYGAITIMLEAYYHRESLFLVSPGSFSPPPKVHSRVIRLTRNERTTLNCDEKLFKRVLKATFGQRRKMMRNTLKPLVEDMDLLKKDVFTCRPEQIGLDEFVEITNLIGQAGKNPL